MNLNDVVFSKKLPNHMETTAKFQVFQDSCSCLGISHSDV